MVSSCSRLMTSTSKAVGRPRLQHGMKMSPGRACEPGSKPGVSLEGARAADWADHYCGTDHCCGADRCCGADHLCVADHLSMADHLCVADNCCRADHCWEWLTIAAGLTIAGGLTISEPTDPPQSC